MPESNVNSPPSRFVSMGEAVRLSGFWRHQIRSWERSGVLEKIEGKYNAGQVIALADAKRKKQAETRLAESIALHLRIHPGTMESIIKEGCPLDPEMALQFWKERKRRLAEKRRELREQNIRDGRTTWQAIAAKLAGISEGYAYALALKFGAPKSPICFWLWRLAFVQSQKADLKVRAAKTKERKKLKNRERYKRQKTDPEYRRKVLGRHKAYRERLSLNPNYKAKRREHYRIYRQKNLERLRAKEAEYNKNPNIRIKRVLRTKLLKSLKAQSATKIFHTVELLGCSPAFLRQYLEGKFKYGMCWENYGTAWHIDHIIPVSSFDLTDSKQQKLAFHFSNLQPLWAGQNLRKGKTVIKPQLPLLLSA